MSNQQNYLLEHRITEFEKEVIAGLATIKTESKEYLSEKMALRVIVGSFLAVGTAVVIAVTSIGNSQKEDLAVAFDTRVAELSKTFDDRISKFEKTMSAIIIKSAGDTTDSLQKVLLGRVQPVNNGVVWAKVVNTDPNSIMIARDEWKASLGANVTSWENIYSDGAQIKGLFILGDDGLFTPLSGKLPQE